jgi:hypothetical protein
MGETNSEPEEKEGAGLPEEEEKALAPLEEEKTKGVSEEVSPLEARILDGAPPEVVQMLESAPPEVRRQIVSFFSMIMSRGLIPDPVASKLADKVTGDHITQLIESSDKDSEREFKNCQWGRVFQFAIAVIGLVFFAFLVVQLKAANPELLKDLVIGVASFLGGLGTGLGYMAIKKGRS